MSSLLEKIRAKPESFRKTLFWLVVIFLGVVFFGFWIILVRQRVAGFTNERLRQDLNLPALQEQFDKRPKLEMPEININGLLATPTPSVKQ